MTTRTAADGVIHADALYTLGELQRRLGLTRSAWRQARAAGLPAVKVGKRTFVVGRQVIVWIEQQGCQQSD